MKRSYQTQIGLIMLMAGFTSLLSGQVITSVPDSVAFPNTLYSYDVNVTSSADSTFSLLYGRPGMTIDSITGLISWVPASLDQGGMVVVSAEADDVVQVDTFYIYMNNQVFCDDKIVSYWKLDEESGTAYSDYANANNATAVVALVDTAGILGNAKIFSPAADNRVRVTDANQYEWNRGDSISISLWFKSYENITGTNQVFIGRLGAGNEPNTKHSWWIGMDTDENVRFFLTNSTGVVTYDEGSTNYNGVQMTTADSGYAYNDNQWHHVVAVYEGSAADSTDALLYVDGNLMHKKRFQFSIANFIANSDLFLGWWENVWSATNVFEYDGALDDIAFYKRGLSAAEIETIFQDGLGGEPLCRPGTHAPIFTSKSVASVYEKSEFLYEIKASDLDGDSIDITAVKPVWLTFTDNGDGSAELKGTPGNDEVGIHNIVLSVTDGEFTTQQAFTIEVINVNDPPVFDGQFPINTDEDVPVTITLDHLIVTDVDNVYPDDFTLIILPENPGDSFTVDGNTVTPALDFYGDLIVGFKLTDQVDTISGQLTIEVSPVNDLPEVTSEPVDSAKVGQLYQYTITATDVDDDVLTFTAIAKPDWLTLTTLGNKEAMLSGTPASIDAGEASVSIRIKDSDPDGITHAFNITVEPILVGIAVTKTDGIRVFPSPVRHEITFDLTDNNGKFSRLQILSVTGKLVLDAEIAESENHIKQNVASLNKGLYLFRLLGEKETFTGRFIKE